MDLNYRREASVGLLVVAGIVLFFFGTLWLQGKTFGTGPERSVTVSDVSGLKVGSLVTMGGVPAGKVTEIAFVGPGRVRVDFSIKPFVDLREDAAAEVYSVSLVGEVALRLEPGTAARPLPADRELRPINSVGLREQALGLKGKADTLLDGANAIVNQRTADELYATAKALRATLEATQRLMATYGNVNAGPVAELTATMAEFRSLAARMDSALADPAVARTLQRADTLTGNLAAMTAQFTATGARLDSLLVGVERGEGSLGRFARDSTFHDATVRLLQSMDSLLQDLRKHPGKIGVTVKLF